MICVALALHDQSREDRRKRGPHSIPMRTATPRETTPVDALGLPLPDGESAQVPIDLGEQPGKIELAGTRLPG